MFIVALLTATTVKLTKQILCFQFAPQEKTVLKWGIAQTLPALIVSIAPNMCRILSVIQQGDTAYAPVHLVTIETHQEILVLKVSFLINVLNNLGQDIPQSNSKYCSPGVLGDTCGVDDDCFPAVEFSVCNVVCVCQIGWRQTSKEACIKRIFQILFPIRNTITILQNDN